MEVSGEAVGILVALLGVTVPAVFFLGRVQADLEGLRRDVESLKGQVNGLQVDYGVLSATVVVKDVSAEDSRTTSE